jgi:hypothetical protein
LFVKAVLERVPEGKSSFSGGGNRSSKRWRDLRFDCFQLQVSLYRFVEWLQQQDWYEEALASCNPEITPTIYSGHSLNQSQKVKPLTLFPIASSQRNIQNT